MPYDRETMALIEQAGRVIEECRQHDQLRAEREEILRKSHSADLIHKSYENPAPSQQEFMDPQEQLKWDQWARSVVKQALDDQPEFSEVQTGAIAEFVTGYVEEELQPLRDRITGLETELGQLRAELNVLTGVQRGEIKEIHKKLRGEVHTRRRDDDPKVA